MTQQRTSAALDAALDYARGGFPVFPVFAIAEPAPQPIVEQWRAGKLTKKAAQSHARCGCGKPCDSPGKHPITPNGVKGATTDEQQIKAWWRHNPTANVGIAMPPGYVALDFDTYESGARSKLEQVRELMGLARVGETLEQQSGAGGVHLVFQGVPDGVQLGSTLDSEKGVDLIHAGNRYLVAEPSNHWTGGVYSWANDNVAVAPLPTPVLNRCRRGAKPTQPRARKAAVDVEREQRSVTMPLDYDGSDEDWAVEIAAKLAPPAIANGEPGSPEHGHTTLSRVANYVIVGCAQDVETALEILWEEYNPRCSPPWDEDERGDFERTVRAVDGSRGDAEPGYLVASERVREAAARAEERKAAKAAERAQRERPATATPATPAVGPSDALAVLGTVADLSQPPKPLKYMCRGLCLAPGKISAIVGYAGTSKGPLATWIGLSIAAGLPLWGHAVTRARVLYLDYETGRLAELRAHRIANALGVDLAQLREEGWITFVHATAPITVERLEALKSVITTVGIGVVVHDSYTSAVAADQNDVEISHVAFALGTMSRETECLQLAVVHARKSKSGGAGGLESISGHNALAAALQSAIELTRPDARDESSIEVTCLRAPEGGFAPFGIRWEDVADPRPEAHSTSVRASAHRQGQPDSVKWGLRAVPAEAARSKEAAKAPRADANEHTRRQEIVKYLARPTAPREGASLTKIREQATGDYTPIKNSVLALVQAGVVRVVEGHAHDLYELAPESQQLRKALLELGLTLQRAQTPVGKAVD